jgi:hypothetical protein
MLILKASQPKSIQQLHIQLNHLPRNTSTTYLVDFRDHCHLTGKYRGAAHNECNLNYSFTQRIPVILHNLRGYDSHLIMQGLWKVKE